MGIPQAPQHDPSRSAPTAGKAASAARLLYGRVMRQDASLEGFGIRQAGDQTINRRDVERIVNEHVGAFGELDDVA